MVGLIDLPQHVLGNILILVGCIVRATCRSMRDAFDSCNTRLVLGGASPPPSVGGAPAAGPSGLSAEQRGRELQRLLPALLDRTPGEVTLRLKPWVRAIWCLCGLSQLPTHQLQQLDITFDFTYFRELALVPLKQRPAGAYSNLSQLLGGCSSLRSLPLRHCCVAQGLPTLLSALRTPALERLRLSNSRSLTSLSCLTHLVGLRELYLGFGVRGLSDLSPLTACTGLQSLDLRNACDPLLSLASASTLISLTSLEFGASKDSHYNLAPLTTLTRLRYLGVYDCQVTLAPSPRHQKRLLLAPFPYLEELHLINFTLLNLAPLTACTALKCVGLRLCAFPTSNGHHAVSTCGLSDLAPLVACPVLHTLDLALCTLPAGGGEGGGEGVSAHCRCAQLAEVGLSSSGDEEEEDNVARVREVLSASRGINVVRASRGSWCKSEGR